jgi:hypothetical protein
VREADVRRGPGESVGVGVVVGLLARRRRGESVEGAGGVSVGGGGRVVDGGADTHARAIVGTVGLVGAWLRHWPGRLGHGAEELCLYPGALGLS